MPLAYVFTAYGGPETQRFAELPRPEPGPGEVLVKVRAAGINPVDWKVREGMHRAFLPLRLPAVLGREVAGVVAATGPGVTGFAADDRIVGSTVGGSGGYAELALLVADRSAQMPAGLSFTDAAALPIAAGAAYDSLSNLGLGPVSGETLLILGIGGGVGTMAAQLAVLSGARVIGTASSAKRAFVESLGAQAIAYDADDVPHRLRDLQLDAVLDLVGDKALHDVADVITDRTRVLSVADEHVRQRFGARPVSRLDDPTTLSTLADLVAAGNVNPHVRHVFPFTEAAEALALVESGHAKGKVVLDLTPYRAA